MAKENIAVIENAGNSARIDRLRAAGVPVFGVDFEPGRSAGASAGVVESLAGAEWLAFSDLRAADIFLADLEALGIEPFSLDEVSIYASGEAVSDRLRFAQVHSDLIPRKLGEPEELEEIGSYCGKGNLDGTNFCVLHTGDTCEFPVTGLRASGAAVSLTRLDLPGARKTDAKTLALLKGGAFERYHFFSPFDVYDLVQLLAPQRLSVALKSAQVTASDAASSRSLAERGVLARVSDLKS